jgi:ATP-dependent 26S proteasome regulatory subunit
MSRAVTVEVSTDPYEANGQHLRDELARADILVRAQVVRWRLTIGSNKPENLWGMIHVSDPEIDHYLEAPIACDQDLPSAILESVSGFWDAEKTFRGVIRRRVDATAAQVDLRLQRLRTRFELTPAEFDIVLLCLLPEIDFRYRRIFGYLQDDASKSSAPIDLLGQMVHPKAPSLEEKRRLFEPGGALVEWRLIYFTSDTEGRAGRAVRLDERIASFLLGCDQFDPRLEPVLGLLSQGNSWDSLYVPQATLDALRAFAAKAPPASVVVMHGLPGSGRAKAARAVCAARGIPLLRLQVERALSGALSWDTLLRLAYREALLQNAALYVDGVDRLQADDRPAHLLVDLTRLAETMATLTCLGTDSASEGSTRLTRYLRFDFPIPRLDLRRAIWLAHLPDMPKTADRAAAAEKLASAFQLNEGQILEAIAAAQALARRRSFTQPELTFLDLSEACRRQAGRRLLGFARRIEPTRGLKLDDVILTEANKRQLSELLERVHLRSRNDQESMVGPALARSKGLLVLFAGPSGTGKTLAAEVIASQEGLDLYKIDASSVVSKWLGETEKNLGRVFADAEGSDALLFFDECDSLFGQRGEISDARDRWANLQTNYLLQRVEEYSGVVILATNLRQNIDEAFLRRIQVIVEFPTPDASLRLAIWHKSISASANGLSEPELRAVADRFSLSGGSIRNVTVEAACRAMAQHRVRIELRDVIDAIAREYQKLGRPITQGEFGEQFYLWALSDVIAPQPPG